MPLRISRRSFVGSSIVAGLATKKAQAIETTTQIPHHRTKLSEPLHSLKNHYELVIVGSGYGGAVAAARLAPHFSTCVLERGREWMPGEFPEKPLETLSHYRSDLNPLGLTEVITNPHLSIIQGSGLGGTSLINGNVILDTDPRVFDLPEWPQEIRQLRRSSEWERIKHEVIATLQGATYQGALPKKTESLRESGNDLGVPFEMTTQAVNFDRYINQPNHVGVHQRPCTLCGSCLIGCNVGAKNTLDTNYLPLAKSRGAKIFSQIEVHAIQPHKKGYRLDLAIHRPFALPERRTVSCDTLILSAGTVGSTGILLRSARKGLPVSMMLGKRFSGNGDMAGLAYNTHKKYNIVSTSQTNPKYQSGASVMSLLRFDDPHDVRKSFVIEDLSSPNALAQILGPLLAWFADTKERGDVIQQEQVMRDYLGIGDSGAFAHSMGYVAIGMDQSKGGLTLIR